MLRSSNGSSLQGFACVAVGAKLLVMGGIYQTNDNDKGTQGFSTVSSGDVHVYNACTNRWSRASSMKTPRSWFAAAVVGDFVYVAGGQGRDCFLNSVEVYDSTKDVWSYVPNMACVRSSCSAFAVNGKVWVIGGEVVRNQYGERPERGSAEVYDPQLGIWKLIPEMWLDTKKVPSPGTVHCGKMLFVYQNKLMMYDEITNKWHRIGYSSGGDAFNNHFSRFGFACESIDEELYIIGGFKVSKQYGSSLQALNTTEVSKVSLEQPSKYTSWRRMANMGTDKGSVLASAVLSS
ncbi:hypothetical protein KP509_32G069700 [Ceratopteris richardii]|nr:hypothetical protein KP509_32G069700 [Ceratopteris richardii]